MAVTLFLFSHNTGYSHALYMGSFVFGIISNDEFDDNQETWKFSKRKYQRGLAPRLQVYQPQVAPREQLISAITKNIRQAAAVHIWRRSSVDIRLHTSCSGGQNVYPSPRVIEPGRRRTYTHGPNRNCTVGLEILADDGQQECRALAPPEYLPPSSPKTTIARTSAPHSLTINPII